MRLDSLRNLIAIAATHDLDMCVLNVKSTYLHGDLDETIYMQQPEGFNNGTPQVCLLTHFLYGLKQSGQCRQDFGSYTARLAVAILGSQTQVSFTFHLWTHFFHFSFVLFVTLTSGISRIMRF